MSFVDGRVIRQRMAKKDARMAKKLAKTHGKMAVKQTGRHEASPSCPAASTASPQSTDEVPMTPKPDPSTTPPVRIQRRRLKGWRMPANTVCVDRSTPWGNPFPITPKSSRREVVFAHKALLHGYFCITQNISTDIQATYHHYVNDNLWRLSGKNLACFCRLDEECHADILLKLANQKHSRRLISLVNAEVRS